MAENPMPYHEAEDYLFGRLTPAARRQFEAQLAQDAALCQFVRELEEGTLALAMSAPPLPAPPEAWANIHAAIATSPRKNFFAFGGFNWLTASVVLTVCVLITFLIPPFRPMNNQPDNNSVAVNSTETQTNIAFHSAHKLAQTNNVNQNQPDMVGTKLSTVKNTAAQTGQTRPGANRFVANNSNNSGQPNATGRGDARKTLALSNPMRRALLAAVARQLGLNDDQTSTPKVDFVDVPNIALNGSPVIGMTPDGTSLELSPPVDLSLLPAEAAGDMPIVVVQDNLVTTLDPTTLPADAGPVSVWEMDGDGNQTLIGGFALGNNPTVITITHADTSGALQYFITVGGTNILGRFPAPSH